MIDARQARTTGISVTRIFRMFPAVLLEHDTATDRSDRREITCTVGSHVVQNVLPENVAWERGNYSERNQTWDRLSSRLDYNTRRLKREISIGDIEVKETEKLYDTMDYIETFICTFYEKFKLFEFFKVCWFTSLWNI